MSPFLQVCAQCGDHDRFLHTVTFTTCPTCGSRYCTRCARSMTVRTGLFRTAVVCPKCRGGPAPQAAPVVVNIPQYQAPPPVVYAPPVRVIERETVKVPCRYCGQMNTNTDRFCAYCGAGVR